MSNPISDPVNDPNGNLAPSLRDTLAANFAAALFLKDTGWSTHPGGQNVEAAYRMADQFLEKRQQLIDR